MSDDLKDCPKSTAAPQPRTGMPPWMAALGEGAKYMCHGQARRVFWGWETSHL